jgi:RNA polymerase sigma-70 factor (ECF subfamily)
MSTTTLTTLDADAFTDLWRSHRDAIRGYLHRRCPHAADELTSETFVRAWAGRDTYRPDAGQPRGWLFTIARNVLIDHLRYEGRRPVLHLDAILAELDDDADRAAILADPADVAAQVADRVTVAALLAGLAERHRQVLALRFVADLDVPATAAVLGCTRQAVKATTFRAVHEARGRVGGAA